jgi:hypothetical protein
LVLEVALVLRFVVSLLSAPVSWLPAVSLDALTLVPAAGSADRRESEPREERKSGREKDVNRS